MDKTWHKYPLSTNSILPRHWCSTLTSLSDHNHQNGMGKDELMITSPFIYGPIFPYDLTPYFDVDLKVPSPITEGPCPCVDLCLSFTNRVKHPLLSSYNSNNSCMWVAKGGYMIMRSLRLQLVLSLLRPITSMDSSYTPQHIPLFLHVRIAHAS